MSNISASDSQSAVLACISAQFTLYFDGRFWVGVLEHHERHRGGDVVGQVITVRAARHVFGGEPSDVELYDFLLARGDELIDRAAASPPVPASRSAGSSSTPRPNPKRAARQAAKEAARARLSTAAQADRILVMHHGNIVEDGTHDQLIAAGGRYATLWSAH